MINKADFTLLYFTLIHVDTSLSEGWDTKTPSEQNM